ncbi:hypothetical protein M409DRAFT_65874 [Zasmidium cellare ATCC 36951]|uniref:Carboxylesterase type B domain-containing protein n=1 Tax=Zasmidium cellare ATCC 36951 TaxID=1080233 RepID=A0A6A6CPG5_ZASCE|nr:uncharacterized protein M409DRAFT_65874 [Zasmidium cellare ATCC 36951]KAF2167772.1 hypothetical protein M409DRAFT_65874 [Zasmidium cellare ATCC 36951]
MVDSNSTERTYVLQTARGSLTGTEVVDTRTNKPIYRRYARIRYALPPVGERRWRKPEPLPADWIFSDGNNNPRNYRKFGAICPQVDAPDDLLNGGNSTEVQNDMSEDCLFLNIWVPAGGEGPAGGWSVQFMYYEFPGGEYTSGHGMQRDYLDPIDIYRDNRDNLRIIVSANFRVGVFGFLASEELLQDAKGTPKCHDRYAVCGNFGFWDLRMALEWTHANVHLFGGNVNNITAGGSGRLTARIIRRAFLFSGAVAVQPDTPQSEKPRKLFFDLCRRFHIDGDLPSEDKIRLLRGVSAEKLLEFSKTLDVGFRPVTDGQGGFVPIWFMRTIRNGELGRRLKELGVQVLIGDASNEAGLYQYLNRKPISSQQDLRTKLTMQYPQDIVDALIVRHEGQNVNWNFIYSQIVADIQCHSAVRGFAHSLFKGGMTAQEVLRYHISWKSKTLAMPLEVGTSHALDFPLWWYSGWRTGFSERDKEDVLNFTRPFARFIRGDISALFGWGTETEYEVRLLAPDGSVRVTEDSMWKEKMGIWNIVRDVQLRRSGSGVARRQVNGGP